MNSNTCEQDKMISARLLVSGKVQGVGFRKFSQASALKLRLFGTVRNLMDGRVELQVEGEREKIETLIRRLEVGPHRSKVEKVGVSWKTALAGYTVFSIML